MCRRGTYQLAFSTQPDRPIFALRRCCDRLRGVTWASGWCVLCWIGSRAGLADCGERVRVPQHVDGSDPVGTDGEGDDGQNAVGSAGRGPDLGGGVGEPGAAVDLFLFGLGFQEDQADPLGWAVLARWR